jgi:YopX protein
MKHREIKFRAWDKINKRMFFFACDSTKDPWAASMVEDKGYTKVPELTPLQQYIDLKDKRGSLIYEGDILEYESNGSKNERAVVYWNSYLLSYYMRIPNIKAGQIIGIPCRAEERKIIGNIYENPELFKQ